MKSFRPTSFVFDHRIENLEQLAHPSNQSDFEKFAVGLQSLVEVSNHGVASGSEQGYRVNEIAAFLGVHYATISRRLRELERSE
jgi:DNA-binding MarR family transcriptional regulator